MQLLRDNLTLWTSSDSAEAEAATGQADAPKEAKADEPKAEAAAAPADAEATGTADKPAAS